MSCDVTSIPPPPFYPIIKLNPAHIGILPQRKLPISRRAYTDCCLLHNYYTRDLFLLCPGPSKPKFAIYINCSELLCLRLKLFHKSDTPHTRFSVGCLHSSWTPSLAVARNIKESKITYIYI